MKKVLIITYYWPPSGGAGVQRWLKFAKYLPEFGWKPIVLTVDEKVASYMQRDESLSNDINPNLKVYKTKSFEPLNILSSLFGKKNVPYGGFSNVNKRSVLQTILRFIRGNLFIPDARLGWNKYAYKKAVQIIDENNIATVVTTSPPHSTQLIGLKLKKARKVKWIADFRDPWTDIYYYKDLLHTKLAHRNDSRKEKAVLEHADVVITNCVSNKNLLQLKINENHKHKFKVITNGYDEDDFTGEIINPEEFTITYAGTIAENYKPEVFFNALSKMVTSFPDISFKLRFVGNVAPAIKLKIVEAGLIDIYEEISYVPHNKLIKFLLSSTVLFYIFPKTSNDKGIAGKLFEYLASSKTIIGLGPTDGDSAKILEECKAGRIFSREQHIEIEKYLNSLIQDWKNKNHIARQDLTYTKFSRRALTKLLSENLE